MGSEMCIRDSYKGVQSDFEISFFLSFFRTFLVSMKQEGEGGKGEEKTLEIKNNNRNSRNGRNSSSSASHSSIYTSVQHR